MKTYNNKICQNTIDQVWIQMKQTVDLNNVTRKVANRAWNDVYIIVWSRVKIPIRLIFDEDT